MKTFSATALITLVAALMSAGIGPASAAVSCYSGGAEFPNRENAKWHVKRACEGWDGNRGALQGHFDAAMTKIGCVEVERGHSLYMTVTNLNTRAGFDLADGDCTYQMSRIVTACLHGGVEDQSGWRFR
jgi:hypothetical protein